MKLNRRGFMATLTGAVAAGPSAAKEALTPSALKMDLFGVGQNFISERTFPAPVEDRETLIKKMARWSDPNWRARAYRDREVYKLSPDVHALRSVSLTAKMRMQKDMDFREFERRNKGWIERALLGEDE